tara:strand:- start:1534 stop:2373 length:840 start_codon:yes stop_codon:yes gene_type:complete
MKTALIITTNPELDSVKFLCAASQKAGMRAKVSTEVEKADFFIHRLYGMNYDDSDLDFLDQLGSPCLNPVGAQRICRDKWLQQNWLLKAGVEVLETFKYPDIPSRDGAWMLKTIRGMQGRGVKRCDSLNDLNEALSNIYDGSYIIQKALDYQNEYRCVFLGKRRFWFRKEGGNLYMGASAQEVKAPSKACEVMADTIADKLYLCFGAVDFLEFEDKFYPIDVNCYPGVKLIKDKMDSVVEMFKESLLGQNVRYDGGNCGVLPGSCGQDERAQKTYGAIR